MILAKAPRPGYAKTRLAKALGVTYAAELAEAFLRDTCEAARALGSARGLLAYAPRDAEAELTDLCAGLDLVPQVDGDLGARMAAALRCAFEAGAERAVLVGSDTPQIGASGLRAGLRALDHSDVVFGPAEDGGYYLVGCRGPFPALFRDVPWSTNRVLEVSRTRARTLGLRTRLLRPLTDVDEAADLDGLRAALEAAPDRAPHTRALLARGPRP